MIEFTVQNSHTFVYGDHKEIDKISILLRYRPEGYYFSKLYRSRQWDGYIKLFSKHTKSFQTGLLPTVIKYLKEEEIEYKIRDERVKPDRKFEFKFIKKYHDLRDYQQKCVDLVEKHHRGVLNLFTGAGKTAISVYIVQKLGVKTLFVAPNTTIMKQSADTFADVFGRKMVGMVYGKEKDADKPITVACVDSLPMFPKQFFDKFDLLILDEFHHASSDTYQDLNKKKFNDIYYRVGLTATFFRNDKSDMKMQSVLSNVLLKIDSKEGIKRGFLTEPYFFLKEFEHTKDTKPYQKAYKELIVENDERNQVIANITKFCQKKKFPTLILVKQIDHGKRLSKMIPKSKFIHGNSTDREKVLERFKKGKIGTIIATNILGEGSDIPRLQALIIAGALKAESDSIQKIGRALRLHENKEKAYILDIYDKNSKFFEKQAKERVKTYQKNYTKKITTI